MGVWTLYNVQSLFAGPSPASGFHFMHYTGGLNNNYENLIQNYNLLQLIDRVQSVSFSANVERKNIEQLGTSSLAARPVINSPFVDLSFDYISNGIKNELRQGLTCNYGRFDYPFSGQPNYTGRVCPISGFLERSLTRTPILVGFGNKPSGGDPFHQYTTTDSRNFFLIQGSEDVRRNEYREDFTTPDTLRNIDPRANLYGVTSFGNCYANSYRASASIGSFPKVTFNYICENVKFDVSGSGIEIPAIVPRTRQNVSGKHAVIPQNFDEMGPSSLLPGDITLSVLVNGSQDLMNLGYKFSDISIQGYELSMDLQREALGSIGYVAPLDRRINLPIFCNLTVSMIVCDIQSGNLVNLVNQDTDYDISIKVKNPCCFPGYSVSTGNPHQNGITNVYKDIAIQYDFLKAKFETISYSTAIGSPKIANLNFSVEVDPEDLTKGFFISGLLNVEKNAGYLLYENPTGISADDSMYLTYDDGSPIVLDWSPLF